jgi:hypothetical protein
MAGLANVSVIWPRYSISKLSFDMLFSYSVIFSGWAYFLNVQYLTDLYLETYCI